MRPSAAIAIVLLLASAAASEAQSDPVETYLASAESKAANVIDSAGAQGRGIAMEAGQAALNAIASFRSAFADSLQVSQGALQGQEADFFSKLRSSMDRLDGYLKDQTTNLQGVGDTLAGAVSNLPFSKDIPRVTRVGPLFVVAGESADEELVVHGIGLSNGSPVLHVAGAEVRPNTVTDSELRFPMPAAAARTNGLSRVRAELRLFERKTQILLPDSYAPRSYPIRIAVYPATAGEFSITPRRRVSGTESKQQITPEYRCDSPRGEGSHTVVANVVASPGWTIDPSSIRYGRTYSNHGSFTMNTTSPAGFTATLTCTGWGRKVIAGVVIDQGSIGVEKGGFSYMESRATTSLEDGRPIGGSLRWGESRAVSNLPPDTETVILTFKLFNGQTVALEGAGSGGINRAIALDFNAASKIALLTVSEIEQVLRR